MSLQFYAGGAGSGKSHRLYTHILQEAAALPGRHFFIIVPEQYSLRTQKHLVDLSPGKGILNIDVLSLNRLAYRVFAETGEDMGELLEENGKSILLHKLAIDLQDELPYLGKRLSRPGQIEELKSVLSELRQYRTSPAEILADNADLSPLLAAKLRDLKTIDDAFSAALEGTYMTAEDVPQRLAALIDRSALLKDAVVAFDGFTGFTPVQLPVLSALLRHAGEVLITAEADPDRDLTLPVPDEDLFAMSHKMTVSLTELARTQGIPVLPPVICRGEGTPVRPSGLAHLTDHMFRPGQPKPPADPAGVRLLSARTPEEEVRMCAASIRRYVREDALRYRDLAILTCDLSLYGDLIRRVFPEYGIPVFIDERRNAAPEPYVEFLRAVLEVFDEGWTAPSVIRLLRTGFTGISEDETDRLENYLTALGIRGRAAFESQFVLHYTGQDPAEVPELDAVRKKIAEFFIPFAKRFAASRPASEKTTVLYELSASLGIQEQLLAMAETLKEAGNEDGAYARSRIYEQVIALFDKTASVLGDTPMTVSEYRAILEAALLSIRIGVIPPRDDTVQAGDLMRSRLGATEVLFILGANDGILPKTEEPGGLLTAGDRQTLLVRGFPLSPTSRERLFAQQFYLYLAFSKPGRALLLSYAEQNVETALHPSFIVGRIAGLLGIRVENYEKYLPEVPAEALRRLAALLSARIAPEESAALCHAIRAEGNEELSLDRLLHAAKGTEPPDSIGQAAAAALFGSLSGSSASRLEMFAHCAFRHFASYGLRLREREEFSYKALDRGILLHEILEKYGRHLAENALSWTALPEEERDRIVTKYAEDTAALYGNRLMYKDASLRYEVTRLARVAKRAVDTVTRQLAAGDFIPSGLETAFRNGPFRGRIDRIDLAESKDGVYVKIVDYKTGQESFDITSVYYGLQLQLVMYLSAALHTVSEQTGKYAVPAAVFYQPVKDLLLSDLPEDADEEVIQKELLKKLRGSGIVSADPEVLARLDHTLTAGAASDVIPVTLKNDGFPSARSSAIDPLDLLCISAYGEKKAADLMQEILGGSIRVAPIRLKKDDACSFCPYRSVCRINAGDGKARNLKPMKTQDAIAAMEKALHPVSSNNTEDSDKPEGNGIS